MVHSGLMVILAHDQWCEWLNDDHCNDTIVILGDYMQGFKIIAK